MAENGTSQGLNWIKDKGKNYKLRITNLLWPRSIPLCTLHDISVQFLWNNQVFEGRGTSASIELAITKALAEATERAIFKSITTAPNTNGFSAHTSIDASTEHAYGEILERDAFLSFWLTGYYKDKHAIDSSFPEKWIGLWSQKQTGITLTCYDLSYSNHYVSAVQINGLEHEKSFGNIWGLGNSSQTNKSATEKALVEAIRKYVHLTKESYRPDLGALNNYNRPLISPHDHTLMAMKTEHAISRQKFTERKFPEFYSKNAPPTKSAHCTHWDAKKFMLAPFKVTQAQIDTLQPMFFGDTEVQKLNTNKWTQIIGVDFFNKICRIPHPLG